MTQDEIDTMWQQAMRQSIQQGEMFTRYQFAKLLAEKALADHAMQEVQRLGQEIEPDDIASIIACRDMLDAQPVPPRAEQEPMLLFQSHRDGFWCVDLTCAKCYSADFRLKHTTPPQRKPLTDEEIFACENSIPDEIVSDRDWCIHFARAIEAKIKENT